MRSCGLVDHRLKFVTTQFQIRFIFHNFEENLKAKLNFSLRFRWALRTIDDASKSFVVTLKIQASE